jgi:hypothetical protein
MNLALLPELSHTLMATQYSGSQAEKPITTFCFTKPD